VWWLLSFALSRNVLHFSQTSRTAYSDFNGFNWSEIVNLCCAWVVFKAFDSSSVHLSTSSGVIFPSSVKLKLCAI
jgi:hypothetical protein